MYLYMKWSFEYVHCHLNLNRLCKLNLIHGQRLLLSIFGYTSELRLDQSQGIGKDVF